ncbi:SulP family inorganic anion transporter [uncultured Microbacterium sp.]|uniref:SulP family inorganic anion transporter n=1 Tax=uncultured Microbacterium sp. TaxID=191216 RepID=UPI0035C9E018
MALRRVLKDVVAGAIHGLVSVPDGLASGLLAGVNPVSGLYGYLVGTAAGAIATSSVFMSVQGTGAMAVIIADVDVLHSGSDPAGALATLGILTGVIMLALGLLRLGSLVRFVPNAVLVGFINAVAINIILGQFSAFTGYTSAAANRLFRAVETIFHPQSFSWPTVLIGVLTIALIVLLERTPLGALSLFAAVVAASALCLLPFFDSVELLNDIAVIPPGLPMPVLPALDVIGVLLIPALSLAFVGLVQGAAISQSIPNPDGNFPDVSGDFRGQGIANIASGFLRGTPVGGSMSATAVVLAAGARSRLANLTAAVVMAIVILLFSGLAGYIAMPALAALLMLVGARMFKPRAILTVLRTGPTQAVITLVTFTLTLVIPLQYAVLIGVGLSIILFVASQANRVKVVRWSFGGGALPTEETPPAVLPAGEIVVLNIYGSLFFASAAALVEQLPTVPADAGPAVVIVRLRGKDDLGSTIIQALLRYRAEVRAAGGHLLLAGVGPSLLDQLEKSRALGEIGSANVFIATRRVGESLENALDRARELQDENYVG